MLVVLTVSGHQVCDGAGPFANPAGGLCCAGPEVWCLGLTHEHSPTAAAQSQVPRTFHCLCTLYTGCLRGGTTHVVPRLAGIPRCSARLLSAVAVVWVERRPAHCCHCYSVCFIHILLRRSVVAAMVPLPLVLHHHRCCHHHHRRRCRRLHRTIPPRD